MVEIKSTDRYPSKQGSDHRDRWGNENENTGKDAVGGWWVCIGGCLKMVSKSPMWVVKMCKTIPPIQCAHAQEFLHLSGPGYQDLITFV